MDVLFKLLGYGLTDRLLIFVVTVYVLAFELNAQQRLELTWPLSFLASATIIAFTVRPSSLRKLTDKASAVAERLKSGS